MNRRRAIISIPDGLLEHVLTTEARLELPQGTHVTGASYDPVRLATLLVITGTQLDEVREGAEPPVLPATIIEGP